MMRRGAPDRKASSTDTNGCQKRRADDGTAACCHAGWLQPIVVSLLRQSCLPSSSQSSGFARSHAHSVSPEIYNEARGVPGNVRPLHGGEERGRKSEERKRQVSFGTSSPRRVSCASSFLVLTHLVSSSHRAAHQHAHPLSAPPERPPRASSWDKEREALHVQAFEAERIASMRACRELAADLRDLLEVTSPRARASRMRSLTWRSSRSGGAGSHCRPRLSDISARRARGVVGWHESDRGPCCSTTG